MAAEFRPAESLVTKMVGAGASRNPRAGCLDGCPFLAGIVEVEEGEVNGQELCIASHSIARISFAKEPHVEQVSRSDRPATPPSLATLRALLVTDGITPRSLTDRFVSEPCLAPRLSFSLTSCTRQDGGAPWFSHLVLGWRQ